MLKYIGDFDKLKDYGFEIKSDYDFKMYKGGYYGIELEDGEINIATNKEYNGTIELDLLSSLTEGNAIDLLYDLIKDGLVIKVER